MKGSDVVRVCPDCLEQVYRIEGLDEAQIAELIARHQPANEGSTALSLYRRSDGTLMSANIGCGLVKFLSFLYSWPVVAILVGVYFAVGSGDYGTHHTMLFVLANYLAMSFTWISFALLSRFKDGLLERIKQPRLRAYRVWLGTTAIYGLGFWCIFQLLPVPVWNIKSSLLARGYTVLMVGSLAVAYAITKVGRERVKHIGLLKQEERPMIE